jgi:hypothetical protein
MRLLPRSAKGTWLLAMALWVGLCIGGWNVMPIVPRGTLRLPSDSYLLCFGPNAETALVLRYVLPVAGVIVDHHSLEVYSTSSENPKEILLQNCGFIQLVGKSADGQTLLLRETDVPHPRLFQIDLPLWSIHPLRADMTDASTAQWKPAVPDHQFRVTRDDATKSLVLWDIMRERRHAVLTGLNPPFAFSADGRWFVAGSGDEPINRISVIDLTTLATRRTLMLPLESPPIEWLRDVALTADGSYAIAEVIGPQESPGKTLCMNVATGTGCFCGAAGPCGVCGIPVGQHSLVSESSAWSQDVPQLQCFDLDSGTIKWTVPTENRTPWELSPDGQTLALWVVERRLGFFEFLADRTGIGRPFSPKERIGPAFYDAGTGRFLGALPTTAHRFLDGHSARWSSPPMRWAPDGHAVAIGHLFVSSDRPNWGEWVVWDYPPRKPPSCFALAAGILALPIAWVARRRVRRLRKEAA